MLLPVDNGRIPGTGISKTDPSDKTSIGPTSISCGE